MRRALALSVATLLTSCSGLPSDGDSDLPFFPDYPDTFNAVEATGSLWYDGDCIAIELDTGEKLVPLFRQGSSIAGLEERIGPLDSGQRVSVSGYNRLRQVPEDIVRDLARRGCVGTPIVFGALMPPQPLPKPPTPE